jgi:hypothetical protein
MKKLLLLLLIAICGIGYRSETIMQAIGMAKPAPPVKAMTVEQLFAASNAGSASAPGGKKPAAGMTIHEFAELAKKDPDAYRKLLQSHQQEQERTEVDKLMNFFTRLKYE